MSAARRTVAAALTFGLACAGCGSALGPRAATPTTVPAATITSVPPAPPAVTQDIARWTTAAQPQATLPADPAKVLALSARLLVVADDSGLWRSADAGRTWHRTLTFAVAASWEYAGRAGSGAAVLVDGDELYLSGNGLTWRQVTPAVADDPGRPHYLGYVSVLFNGTGPGAAGLAWGQETQAGAVDGGPLEHTSDGGRHWEPITGTDDIGDVSFSPDGRTVLADQSRPQTAPGQCAQSMGRSTDAGTTWQRVPFACAGFGPITFTDDRHAYTEGTQRMTTTDGGLTWSVQAALVIDRPALQFKDAAADPMETDPGHAPLLRSTDGGRSWRPTGRQGSAVSWSGRTVLLAGSAEGFPGLSVSRDAGVTWSRLVPQTDLHLLAISGTAGDLLAVTNDSGATSQDGGASWASFPLPNEPAGQPYAIAKAGSTVLVAEASDVTRSTDDGRTWTKVAVPPGSQFLSDGSLAIDHSDPTHAIAFAQSSFSSARCGSVVFVTADGGRHWRRQTSAPNGVSGPVGYDHHVVVATAGCNFTSSLVISTDDGRHWATDDPQPGYQMSSAGVADGSIWVAGYDGNPRDSPDAIVLVSPDLGRTWTLHRLRRFRLDPYTTGTPQVVPLSATSALLTTGDSTVWRTADAGATWQQQRPQLPAP